VRLFPLGYLKAINRLSIKEINYNISFIRNGAAGGWGYPFPFRVREKNDGNAEFALLADVNGIKPTGAKQVSRLQ
jgi:hypothetical protein